MGKSFVDKENLELFQQYINGAMNKINSSIDKKVDEKFTSFIEDNVSDGEILDARGGERTLGTRLNKQDKKIEALNNSNKSISVLNFGAVGDGITDDSEAIKKAMLTFKDNVMNYLYFPQGYKFKCSFEITKPNVKILGGGTIDGTITVFIQESISDFQVEDITFIGNNPIYFKKCRGGAIRKNRFYNNNISMLFRANEGEQGQTNARIQISDNLFENNNYIIKQEQIVSSKLSLADFHFINNVCKWSKYTHIDIETSDGFVIKGNTFFTDKTMPSIKHHIKVSAWSSWCIIEGNNFFESGAESVWLNGVDNFNITGNNFAWCGKRERVGAIRISNPRYKRVYSIIANNNINVPSQCGIHIENSAYINIKNNFITLEEMQDFKGSTPIDTNKWFGVYVTNNTDNRLKLSIDNYLNKNNKQCNPTIEVSTSSSFEYLDIDESVTELNGYYDEIRITQDCNINSIINGCQGKRLTIYSYANVVIQNTSTIKLKNDRNAKLSTRDVITLFNKDGIWIELSRNEYVTNKVKVSTGETVVDLINDENIIRMSNETNEVILSNLTNAYNGKQITIISNGSNNKVSHSANIKLRDGITVLIPNGRSLTLICDNKVWYEIGRSFA